jgi:hypothetical protein
MPVASPKKEGAMKELDEVRKQARAAREELARAEETLDGRRNLLRHRQSQLAGLSRLGEAEDEEEEGVSPERISALQAEVAELESQVEKDVQSIRALKGAPLGRPEAFTAQAQPWELVEGLDDRLPFLLLPLRLETRFMTVAGHKELWVRIYPDDIAVQTHEKNLTRDEVDAGMTYWREQWRSRQAGSAEDRQAIRKGAWRVLAEAYGGPRAAWIARQTRPESLDVPEVGDLQFPQFPEETLKAESWSQAPSSRVLPDCFVVMGFFQGKEVFRKAGSPIPDPLIVGPDPQAVEVDFRQEDGKLLVGEDIAWIYDFKKAVQVGMGVQIELEPPFDSQGLSRLLVLGLRLSADEKESQTLVEELFEGHSYSPDGLSLVPQGTPTNNTERQGSGFSSVDPGAETSFAVETGGPLFEPVDDPTEKRDGQWLVEALGIRHRPFQRIQHAGRGDIREAYLMNTALWSGTLGYYLEEMLDVSLQTIGQVRSFFSDYVTGRGLLPAIRVGSQPYGILLASDFSRWKWSPELDGAQLPILEDLYGLMRMLDKTMSALIPEAAHVGAPGDPFQNLLDTLGLQAASVEFYRRHAVGLEYLWNYEGFTPGAFQGQMMIEVLRELARSSLNELGIDPSRPPSIFSLSFFLRQDQIRDPLVDDLPEDEVEKLSETRKLRAAYAAPDPQNPGASIAANYIGWLAFSPYQVLKNQRFENLSGETQPIPRPLLYRMLRAGLLQAIHDATLRLYIRSRLLPRGVRREVELNNIQEGRTVTRWEFMDADISQVLPNVSGKSESIAEFLLSEEGLALPDAEDLRAVVESLRALADLSTAQLERIFVEHVDLCSYRLDAWQTGCFNRRLLQQRKIAAFDEVKSSNSHPPESEGAFDKRVLGLYLGAFGWLEDVRPAPEPLPADLALIPTSLHDPQQDGALLEQPDNAGFIHAPSLNHAVTAAVLRNAYLTHFDPTHPEKMAVDLSSERVRTALAFMEGVRNGQELGALLGYQFERGLHDRYGDPTLNQFIPLFRQKYPLVADKITQDPGGEPIESKEARNVFDGYALVEAAFIRETPLPYPYGVPGLPAAGTTQGKAIRAEVDRMASALDAIADLSLAEGVYQVAQGNFDRAGAMLKAMTQGESPAEPELIRTPRSGTAITLRAALHLQTTDVPTPWPGAPSRRAVMEPGLNKWLGDLLPRPGKIHYFARLGGEPPVEQNLAWLGLQPIDLVTITGDDLGGPASELERRIAYENRRKRQDDTLEVQIDFMAEPADPKAVTLFELLPLLRALRRIVTNSRPLGAGDYQLPSEATSDPAADPNPQGIVLGDLKTRVHAAVAAFEATVEAVGAAIPPPGPDGQPDTRRANASVLRAALRGLANFGVPDAFPLSAFGSSPEAKASLTRQAVQIHAVAARNLAAAEVFEAAGDDASQVAAQRADQYRHAAQAIFGPAFNLIPLFNFKNRVELRAAAKFRDAPPADNLTRHHQENPLIVDEWLQGAARVQPNLGNLETAFILGESFGNSVPQLKPIQVPYRKTDYWVAVEYPETFDPQGEFLSVLQVLSSAGFQTGEQQSGLLIDEWIEVIPSKSETTGIAFHFNQPNSEPPQALLLAVTPEITGKWTWDKLVGILQNTFHRAQLRAVEPDQLADTAFGHLLPAILTPVASHRFATIATDLVYQTAVKLPRNPHV